MQVPIFDDGRGGLGPMAGNGGDNSGSGTATAFGGSNGYSRDASMDGLDCLQDIRWARLLSCTRQVAAAGHLQGSCKTASPLPREEASIDSVLRLANSGNGPYPCCPAVARVLLLDKAEFCCGVFEV